RGIKLRSGDTCVGMVVADPDATLLTMCEKGYGKRTPIGPNSPAGAEIEEQETGEETGVRGQETAESSGPVAADQEATAEATAEATEEGTDEGGDSTSSRYPTKGRGTMGVRDIKTTDRNGQVVA